MFQFFKEKQNRNFILITLLIFVIGIYLGSLNKEFFQEKFSFLYDKPEVDETKVDLTDFWKAWDSIDEKYPEAKNVDNQERVYGAIKGLVGSLGDPYSTFFTPEETKVFEEDISGNFSGVGMEVGMKENILTVIAPLKNTPAYKAGIKSGDKILKIDETITNDISVEEAIKLIRGEKGTSVRLTIFRESEAKPREVSIVRDVINVPSLDTEKLSGNIFMIKLYSFSANSTKLFRDAMKEFYNSNSDKLIIDLRGNPGGYLESAVDMASWFLPSSEVVLIEDYGNNQKQKLYNSYGYDLFNDNLKFVILIDGGSASASEILAGAMQDYKKAKIVGEQSYGKGSVQEVVDITKDTILKITVANWLTPKGASISEKGITPDVVVDRGDDEKRDLQLEKAIELLQKWEPIN